MKKEGKRLSWAVFWSIVGPAFLGTRWRYALIIFCIVVTALAQVAEPVLFGRIIDEIGFGTATLLERVTPILLFWVSAFVVKIVVGQGAMWLSWEAGNVVDLAFLRIILRRMIFWDPDRFGKESSGAIAKRVDQVWDKMDDFSGRMLVDVLPQVIGFVAVFIAGMVINWKMTLASLVVIPIIALVTLVVYTRTHEKQEKLAVFWEGLSAQVYETLSNILPIKIFSGEERVLKDLDSRAEKVIRQQNELNRVWGALETGSGLLRLCARIIVIGFGIYLISNGEITLGVLTTFLGMLNQMLSPFDYLLADVLRRARKIQGAFGQLSKDWDEKNLIEEVPSPVRLQNAAGAISFKNVSYTYPGKSQYALRNISLTVPAGKSLALVGRSGSGKSTLVKFVNRFLDPLSGAVTIDGVDLRRAKIQDVRRSVGVVQQDTVLFNDTIFNNIRFANPKATRKEIEAACKSAQAHEFILKLPKGYNTLVGERGVKLSGGERQRLSLARVFLADPPILILDESTSALDSETEANVQGALAKAMKQRTTIVIAHRLSTVYSADRIVVLDQGRIVEQGTHEELLNDGGVYDKLWRLQSGGYLPE
ncbi:MAG: ABC transporter ATP-binding protein [Patescibacteria group bacterium]|jgi:ATP-binding cassette subfamily B protein